MYYILHFDLEFITAEDETSKLPMTRAIELAILDDNYILRGQRIILLPEPERHTRDALSQCWGMGIEMIISFLSPTDTRYLVFPSWNHLTTFHIMKKRCRLHTDSSGNITIQNLLFESGMFDTSLSPESMPLDELVSITQMIGLRLLADHHEVDLVSYLAKKEAEKKRIAKNCDYVADARSGVFHGNDSTCLKGIPLDDWKEPGRHPVKNGYRPCTVCLGQPRDTGTNLPGKPLQKRLINGDYVDSGKAIAYCHNPTHRGYLSKNLVKSHDCIAKKCSLLKKVDPGYWQPLEKEMQDKKIRREQIKEEARRKKDRDNLIRKTLEDCGHIHITSIREEQCDLLVITYIYDQRVDLSDEIRFLRSELGKSILLKPRIASNDVIEQLISKPRRKTHMEKGGRSE